MGLSSSDTTEQSGAHKPRKPQRGIQGPYGPREKEQEVLQNRTSALQPSSGTNMAGTVALREQEEHCESDAVGKLRPGVLLESQVVGSDRVASPVPSRRSRSVIQARAQGALMRHLLRESQQPLVKPVRTSETRAVGKRKRTAEPRKKEQ
ncbi:hypothetical protein FVE85_8321 [Porphyridium purpureum]|uniref:Uncharacterized protein n=1 Tax=Porphyridium purpureum TaxID=35688 RepID=A0A5J4YK79_PORPP|nr:hypothetical protein FVE85_8321 [Porphyridium purpureum]|eukprot:POR5147..scf244_11